MKKEKRYLGVMICLLGILTLSVGGSREVQADAEKNELKGSAELYNMEVVEMAKSGTEVKVTGDLRCFDEKYQETEAGKSCSLMPLYTEECRFLDADLNGDENMDWLMYDGSYLHVFTVAEDEVKHVAAVRCESSMGAPEVLYQESTDTFSIRQLVTGRTCNEMVMKIKDGTCTQIVTLADSVGQMLADGSVPKFYYKDGSETTEEAYTKEYEKYCQNQKLLTWKP